MATSIHVISSTSVFPYLKEHDTETYMVEILVPLKEKRGDFFHFFDFRISPKDKDGCAMSPQAFIGNEESSSNFRKKIKQSPLVWQAPCCMFHQGTCRQFCSRAQVALRLKGEQRNECWSSAMAHIWQCIFLALLSGTALHCSTKTF